MMAPVIIVAAVDDDAFTRGLRDITRALLKRKPEDACGGLGGSDGYGVDYDCDVFEMHPEWWGDCTDGCPWPVASDDAPHVPACKAGRPNFRHKASGLEIRWYKYIGRSMEYSREVSREEWDRIIAESLEAVS